MKCLYRDNKKQCSAHAMRNSQFCFYHNPDISNQEKKLAQTKGGKDKNGRIKRAMPKISIRTTQGVVVLLENTINAVRGAQMDVRIANCLGFLSGHLLKALEVSELASRLEAVEETLNKFKNGNAKQN